MLRPKHITSDRVVLFGAVLAALVYLQDLRYDFILDDIPLILMNETITSWRNWKTAFLADIFNEQSTTLSGPAAVHYRPIYKLWQMLNEQLFGSVTPWWHLTSLLLHVIVIFLVYHVGMKVMKGRRAAALGALLFALHPVHAESVAYITASTDLLVAVFVLVSFLAYCKYRDENASAAYLVASVLAAALAMLSKETAAVFPWMLVAYEAFRESSPGTERNWKRFLWTLPFFGVVGAYAAVRTRLFGLNTGPGPGGNRLSALLNMPLVLIVYLRSLLLPLRLSFFYPVEWTAHWTALKCTGAAVVIASAEWLWKRYRNRCGIRLLLLWAAILFVPALLGVYAFVREGWVHDRQMYLVSVPVCMIAAAFLTDPAWPRRASVSASFAVVVFLLIDLAVQVPRFADNASIYASALKVAPRSLYLHAYYAAALAGYGRTEEALREYKITAELEPQSPAAHEWYAGTLAELGRDEDAMAEYEKALGLSGPTSTFRSYILSRMADLEIKHSDFPKAVLHLREAVQLSPESPDYHTSLARALGHEGQTQEADEQIRLEAALRQRAAQQRRASGN